MIEPMLALCILYLLFSGCGCKDADDDSARAAAKAKRNPPSPRL